MRIGLFVSFGVGGADKCSYYTALGLKELGEHVLIFYNDKSFPRQSTQWDSDYEQLCRFEQYENFEMHFINDISELKNYNLDIFSTQRSGDDLWLIPNLESNDFDFPIVEVNFHGELKTKADYRIFPSQTLVNFKEITIPHFVIPNPVMPKLTHEDLREEFGIPKDAFVFGKISRPSNDIFTEVPYVAYKQIQTTNTYFIQMGINKATEDIIKFLDLINFIPIQQTLDEERISKFYNTLNVYCHSNRLGETFGNTIAEAQSHRRPIISHLGIKGWPQAQIELLTEMPHFIVKTRDESVYREYAKLMNDLMNHPKLYEAYANYCYLKASRYYDYRVVSKQYQQLFKIIINK